MLTQEDWNIVLFAGMERTSHWAALYFVALMTFGNYVLFNLLVAILVEGFSNQVCCDDNLYFLTLLKYCTYEIKYLITNDMSPLSSTWVLLKYKITVKVVFELEIQ